MRDYFGYEPSIVDGGWLAIDGRRFDVYIGSRIETELEPHVKHRPP